MTTFLVAETARELQQQAIYIHIYVYIYTNTYTHIHTIPSWYWSITTFLVAETARELQQQASQKRHNSGQLCSWQVPIYYIYILCIYIYMYICIHIWELQQLLIFIYENHNKLNRYSCIFVCMYENYNNYSYSYMRTTTSWIENIWF
jgi:hypothetical protein